MHFPEQAGTRATVKTRKKTFRPMSKEKYSKLTLVQRVDYIAEVMLDIRQMVEGTQQALEGRKRKLRSDG